MKIGDKVKLITTNKNWKDLGFENSTIIKVGKHLIIIKSEYGHIKYIKPNEIKTI